MEAETPGSGARTALAGSRFADVRWVATTGSTNSDVMALARDGEPEGVVLVADHQSAGRGRLGRTWQAPERSSLLVSVLLRPPGNLVDVVTMAVALSMVDAVESIAGVETRLKWPNDLVVAVDGTDRKLAGVLAEADWPAGSAPSAGYRPPGDDERVPVVVGVGVNVNWPDEVPAELQAVLVSLDSLTGRPVDREAVLVAFLQALDGRYARLRSAPADRTWLLDEWRAASATLGRRVRIDLGADDLEGTAVDIDDHGRLVVDTLGGERRAIAVGDVVHLRDG
jgi:BirA family biotin operon repressor/biotin-[acetyl-CoA-carboxylase] ligase